MYNRFLNIITVSGLLFGWSNLHAQLDPRLQTSKTDFLDLYQQSIQVKQKPEIVSIFDFSTSMDPLMYHPLYQNNNGKDDDGSTSLYISFPNPTGAISNVRAGSSNTASTLTVSAGTSGTTTSTNTTTQLTLTFRNLVKPDGSIVTAQDAENCMQLKTAAGNEIVAASRATMYTGSSNSGRDIRHWIMAASHIRFQVTAAGTAVQHALHRTLDIPLPWKVMGFNSTGNPLSSKTIKDEQIRKEIEYDDQGKPKGEPKDVVYGSGLDIEYDLTYMVPNGTSAANAKSSLAKYAYTAPSTSGSNPHGGYLYISPWIKSIYLHWLFAARWQSSITAPVNNGTNVGYMYNGDYYVDDSQLAGKFIIFDSAAGISVPNVTPTTTDRLAAGQQSAEWGQGYRGTIDNPNMRDRNKSIKIPKYNVEGKLSGYITDYAYRYSIPPLTRIQANKYAAIQTWVHHQADVYWAFRYLDASGNDSLSNSTKTTLTTTDPMSTRLSGNNSGWTIFNNTKAEGKNATNGNSVKGMKRLAATFSSGSTALAYSTARALVQFNDPNSLFNGTVDGEYLDGGKVSQCANSFLILFTDGNENNGGSMTAKDATPYLDNPSLGINATFSAASGNRQILTGSNKNNLNNNQNWYNLFTMAAVGAHMSDFTLGSLNVEYLQALDPGKRGATQKTGKISDFLPLSIHSRNNTPFAQGLTGIPRRVTTMTVGVSLGGRYTAATGAKRAVFLGAVMGDPSVTNGKVGDFRAFEPPTFHPDGTVDQYNDWLPDASNMEGYPEYGIKAKNAAFFFDATDPDKLTTSLETAFTAAIAKGTNNSTATPSLPFVGASIAGQVYMGSFNTPDGGGAIWTGNLLMYGINKDFVMDSAPTWSATEILGSKSWKDRRLLTRLPGSTDLTKFSDIGPAFTDSTNGLMNLKFTDPVQKNPAGGPLVRNLIEGNQAKVVQFIMGGDTAKDINGDDGRPLSNRPTIMGDVINSSPTVVEYQYDIIKSRLNASNGAGKLSAFSGTDPKFRIILVGTNQGWLHCFGEVSSKDSFGITTAVAEELWAFLPTDFLPYLDYLTNSGNVHRFMVDGTPAIYHLDVPSPITGVGNGIVDYVPNTTQIEPVIAILGLGKGGRSYYALDLEDPFNPTIKWTLIPDEATTFPDTRIEPGSNTNVADVRSIMGKWGFSTATPAFGRVQYGDYLKDAVFISGGLSTGDVEVAMFGHDSAGKPTTPMGRSVMALDVRTGNVLAAHDMSKSIFGDVGPISAGIIPFEFIVNSGTAQRAYFMDYKGGLWAWGATATNKGVPFDNYRIDTSKINDWKLRKVYQDSGTSSIYSVAPAPFRVANFTGKPIGTNIKPAAVGIAMVSGDRNNPVDYYESDLAYPKPTQNHKLTVVFDRQDLDAWSGKAGIDSDSINPGGGTITNNALRTFSGSISNTASSAPCNDTWLQLVTPSCPNYYLAPAGGANPYFGYYIDFPKVNDKFLPKGINTPMVVSGSLFYTIFTPESADPCSGGHGVSHSWVIADVLNPLKEDTNTDARLHSGLAATWSGVASDYIQVGTAGVLQGGTPMAGAEGGAGGSSDSLEIKSIMADPSQGYPKPRVWRVVR
ncbi:MAG: PilC/PilY family type IV pilus protein [Holophagaceae bacterium]|nr:PilC/PilY family type IV pilus protein [Holophagaceae bacterium]